MNSAKAIISKGEDSQNVFDLEHGLAYIRFALARLEKSITSRPRLIAVCGGSSTGKSTHVASAIREYLGQSALVLMQDMFQRFSTEEMDPRYMYDDPRNYSPQECAAILKRAIRWELFEWPSFDFSRREQAAPQALEAAPWIILEGMYAAYGPLSEIADLIVYVEVPSATRIVRRVFRNRYERYPGLAIAARTIASFLRTVSNAHADFVCSQRANAHCIIQSHAPFAKLVERFSIPKINEISDTILIRTFEIDFESRIHLEKTYKHEFVFRILHKGQTYLFEIVDDATAEIMQNWDATSY